MRQLIATSALPEYPDWETADRWLISAYQRAWQRTSSWATASMTEWERA